MGEKNRKPRGRAAGYMPARAFRLTSTPGTGWLTHVLSLPPLIVLALWINDDVSTIVAVFCGVLCIPLFMIAGWLLDAFYWTGIVVDAEGVVLTNRVSRRSMPYSRIIHVKYAPAINPDADDRKGYAWVKIELASGALVELPFIDDPEAAKLTKAIRRRHRAWEDANDERRGRRFLHVAR